MRISLSSDRLMVRVAGILIGALLLEILVSIAFYVHVESETVREDHARRVAELLVVGDRLVGRTGRGDILGVLSTRHLGVALRDRPIPDASANKPSLDPMRASIRQWEPSLAGRALHLDTTHRAGAKREDLIGTLALPDGRWLFFRSNDLYGRWPLAIRILILASMLAIGVLLSAALLLHLLGEPLRALVIAADRIGRGRTIVISEKGPPDVRQVARALNGMQARIGRLVDDRTQALAAMSHDLRTPLSRLKLAAEHARPDDVRTMIEANVEDMETMLASLLAFLRSERDPEDPRSVDLAVLARTLVDQSGDLGRDIHYAGPDHLRIQARPVSLKRALSNIVENALHYGGRTEIALSAGDSGVRLEISDHGPGIPDATMESVMEPFFRLDEARTRHVAGFGLGLPIAKRLIENEGGTLTLANRPEGGLRVTIDLPNERRPAS